MIFKNNFSRLKYDSFRKELSTFGFLDESDATENDLALWTSSMKSVPIENDLELKILDILTEPFKKLLVDERKIKKQAANQIWKRPIKDTRETCDQCKTSLFNGHFACLECGLPI